MVRVILLFLGIVSSLHAELTIVVTGIEGDRGDIRVVVFSKAEGFPDEPEKAWKKFSTPAAKAEGGKLVFKMPDPGKGKFAFVVLHDADGDGKLRKNFFGIPQEGLAISNYQQLKPPKFEVAAMEHPKGELKLKLEY